jgi:hypothetical protein
MTGLTPAVGCIEKALRFPIPKNRQRRNDANIPNFSSEIRLPAPLLKTFVFLPSLSWKMKAQCLETGWAVSTT